MNEFDYIEKYFRPLTNKFGLNLKNDAAIFNQKSSFDLIISTDTLAEGIHFFGNEDPVDLAKKVLGLIYLTWLHWVLNQFFIISH